MLVKFNLKCYANTFVNNFMLNAGQDKRVSIYQTHFVFVPLFSKPILTRQIILSTKNSQEFRKFPFRGEIKPPTPVLLTVHISAALKVLVLGNLFKVFRLDITFAREVSHLGIKMKKIWQSSYSFHYPQWQNALANVMANLSNLNKLPNTRVFVAAENWSVETGVGGFISRQDRSL